MHSKVWGQYLWRTLHSLTFCFPNENVKKETRDLFINLFKLLEKVLPCPVCRKHYIKKLKEKPISHYVNNRNRLVKWLVDLHNNINSGLGKRVLSMAEVNKIYLNGKKEINFNFTDFSTLLKIFTRLNNITYFNLRKFITNIFDINPNNILKTKGLSLYNDINSIQNSDKLNIWINKFDQTIFSNNININKVNNKKVKVLNSNEKKNKNSKLKPKKIIQKNNSKKNNLIKRNNNYNAFLLKYNLIH